MNKILVLLALGILMGGAFAANFKVNAYNYSPAPVTAGEKFTFWVQIQNDSGTDAGKTLVGIEPEYPFTLVEGQKDTQEVASVKASQIAIFKFELNTDSKTLSGTYNLKVRFGEGKFEKNELNAIDVKARAPDIQLVGSSENQLEPGQAKEFVLSFRNNGQDTAKDIVVEFTEDRTVTSTGVVVEREVVPLNSAATYIAEMTPGGEGRAQMTLSANPAAPLKNYTLPVRISFKDSKGTEYTSTAYVGVRVKAQAEMEVIVGTIQPKAIPGGEGEIAFDLFNTGAGTASFVSLEILAPENGIKLDKTESFIGTLEADDFDSFKTKYKVPSTLAPGNYPLTVRLSFRDGENNKITVDKSVEVPVLSAQEAGNANGGIVGMILGALGGLLVLIGLISTARWVLSRLQKK
ncbi:MAG: hypothetical protein HY917_03555 [Candidatus Diapherotrites archaeon]|nr:hypothetical protein [Candidatus Diapherotrites archaeon]